jgi:hypothetical protein
MRKKRKGGCALSVALLVAVQWWSLAEWERRGKVGILSQISLSLKSTPFFLHIPEYFCPLTSTGQIHVVEHATSVIPGAPFSEYSASVL